MRLQGITFRSRSGDGWMADWAAVRVRLPAGFAPRLALATSVLVVLVCMSQSWLLARHDLDHVRSYIDDRGRTLVGQLGLEAARALADHDVDRVQRLVDQVRVASGVVYARVVDHQGLLLAAAGQRPTGIAESTDRRDDSTAGLMSAEAWEFRAAVALTDQARSAAFLGTAAVGMSLDPLHALRRRRLTTGILFATLSTLIGVLGAGLLARAMTRPLSALVHAAERISRGDFAARVESSMQGEVGRLATSFNEMAKSLARNQAALEEKVRELERASHLKSEFLATVSHELRTPLNVIIGYLEMLAGGEGGPITQAQAETIATIERYSRNQLELITSVLDFARLGSGKVSINATRFALAPILTEIQAYQSPRLRPGVELSVTVADVIEVMTDRIKLQEIVRNLVDNAVKFTEAGRIAVHAHITEPGWLAIDVQDSGPGIPAEDAETIFDPFHQLGESSTRGTGGVGLGLSIVRQLTEALGGRVSVTSQLGEGARFRVLIPCALAPDSPDAITTAALDTAAQNTSTVRGRVLSPARRAGGAHRVLTQPVRPGRDR
jgi:signal transduction histidine kinase